MDPCHSFWLPTPPPHSTTPSLPRPHTLTHTQKIVFSSFGGHWMWWPSASLPLRRSGHIPDLPCSGQWVSALPTPMHMTEPGHSSGKNSISDHGIAMPIPAERQKTEKKDPLVLIETLRRLGFEVQQFCSIFKMTFLVGLSIFTSNKSGVARRDQPLWKWWHIKLQVPAQQTVLRKKCGHMWAPCARAGGGGNL